MTGTELANRILALPPEIQSKKVDIEYVGFYGLISGNEVDGLIVPPYLDEKGELIIGKVITEQY